MALVTVQRSPSPSASAETEEQDVPDTSDSNLKSPRQRRRRSKSALKKLQKLFNTVRFVTRLKPCFSESYFTVKGAALILPQSDETAYTRKVTKSHAGDDIQSHLQAMFSVLRPMDTIKVAVKLEGTHTRYLVVVSCIGRQDTEESVILGMDLLEKATIGLILPVWSHMHIQLDGDGGFSIQSDKSIHFFKPVSVQAMWSALQSLNKVVKIAKDRLYIPRGLTHTWIGFYEAKLTSEALLVSEWNATTDIDRSYRTDKNLAAQISGRAVRRTMSSPVGRTVSLESSCEEDIYKLIRLELKNVMMTVDLEEVTCLFLRRAVEEKLGMDLKKYKSFIDTEMMEILGQMDSPSKILDHLYLGSEWNASNLDELQHNGVHHILNISREIDNFYPGVLHYMNVREWDVDQSDLLKYWEDTHRYINKARRRGSKALVHCKMGISRSASTVIAYLMKENKWSLQKAYEFTKSKRNIINPNPGFMKQLEMYEGILNANWNREIFNRHAPVKQMSPTVEMEETEGVQCYSNPEDILAVKMGKASSDPGELPFIHVEQDIELASRSADSTEDSLPDQLSPDAAGKSGKKNFRYSKSEGDQAESDDYISASSTESVYTSSDKMSSDDEAENDDDNDDKKIAGDRESKVFVPINIPDIHTDTVYERQKDVKVETRRCKLEGDKHVLGLDEKFSREGSVSKFRPDGSWIKPESESETENNEIVESEIDAEMQVEADRMDDGGGLWMDAKGNGSTEDKMEVSTEEDNKTEDVASENKHESSENMQTVHQSTTDPYVRENIPWNPGQVLKQKKDIEDKYGTSVSKVKRESLESSEEKSQEVKCSETPMETEKEITVEQTSQTTEKDAKAVSHVKSKESSLQTDQSVKIEIDRGSESSKASPEMRKSVYEEEEIDLPEGIVRKTTMEIEERNKSTLDIPSRNLKRSSSLKSTRVTPKAKDRDNERRKTCIALLSPTHPDYTVREQSDLFSVSSNAELSGAESDPGQAGAAVSLASDDTEEEVNNQTGSVKVYKFMGEELTVQEGLVRKQTMDIESKSQEPLTKQQSKSDVGSSFQEYCSHSTDTAVDSKQPISDSNLKHAEKSSTEQNKNKKTENDSNIISDTSTEKLGKAEVKDVYDKSDVEITLQKGRTCSSSMFTPVKKQAHPESRFDPETLELIREIGSALLNSPAKSELEENENTDLKEGESLVSHYVKKIERISGVAKRKRGKEIIIIDKNDSVEEKKTDPRSPSGKTCMTKSSSDCENKPGTLKWSPVARKQSLTSQCSKEIEEQTSPPNKSANPKWSPVSKKNSLAAIEKQSPDFTIIDKTNKTAMKSEESHIDKSDLSLKLKSAVSTDTDSDKCKETEKEESEVCSVKKLLGKFEQPEQVSGKVTPVFGSPSVLSPCSNTQCFPGAKSDSSNSNASSPPSACSSHSSGSEVKGQGHLFSRSKSPLLHRQSEPVINLSEKSMVMFESKLKEMGSSLYDRSPVKEESDTDELKAGSGQGDGPAARPKSASYGPAAGRRVNLHQSQSEDQQGFTWEGKKVRKLYGKTHPLAKLEGRKYNDSTRKSPFYNTM
ncbi:protein phosphatase Slingshot homolog 2-like isoform X3 [Mercenaria mercenaria]|uniref:protein phosphatase Slingshot homolog 2-like isoform X3 n=1 Tax=Mercenaria mercenaria TaxID=6596 RepID=UPI00234F15FC|nr:protein phosphatase Slingshot homolog 2-like isoform X3 [Mercenaria mercenaria]